MYILHRKYLPNITSIEHIITSVSLCVSQLTKWDQRSTGRNVPLTFTKLAIETGSQETWLPIVFGRNLKYWYLWCQTRSLINLQHCSYVERAWISIILKWWLKWSSLCGGKSYKKHPMGFKLSPWCLTLDDPELSYI